MSDRFSGRHDKHQQPIHEGDIVRLGDNVIHNGVLVKCIWHARRNDFVYEFITGENTGKCTDMDDDWRSYELVEAPE